MATVGAYEAKTHLSQLFERVAQGETITIAKHGKPVAVLAPPPEKPKVDFDRIWAEMREIRSRVGPYPDGWTIKDYINYGRRF